jgi:hypothetical protein
MSVALDNAGTVDGGTMGSIGGSAISKFTSEADLGGSTGEPPAAARNATAEAMAARRAAGMSSSSPEPSVLSSSSENGLASPRTIPAAVPMAPIPPTPSPMTPPVPSSYEPPPTSSNTTPSSPSTLTFLVGRDAAAVEVEDVSALIAFRSLKAAAAAAAMRAANSAFSVGLRRRLLRVGGVVADAGGGPTIPSGWITLPSEAAPTSEGGTAPSEDDAGAFLFTFAPPLPPPATLEDDAAAVVIVGLLGFLTFLVLRNCGRINPS